MRQRYKMRGGIPENKMEEAVPIRGKQLRGREKSACREGQAHKESGMLSSVPLGGHYGCLPM